MAAKLRQTVRYLHASDGVRLAWAESGAGMPLVKAATWLTHLEYDLDSPVWKHWTAFLSAHFRYIRYDERGCGMSDWDIRDLSFERCVLDLEAVIEAAGVTEPLTLLGISHGAAGCMGYAVRHPERVARLVLCGAFARGALRRGDAEAQRMFQAIADLSSLWGSDNPEFRQVFTSRFIPGGTDDQLRWFNELCQKTASPEQAAAILRARADTDVTALAPSVLAATLVLHARQDVVAPLSEGRMLASSIPNAQFDLSRLFDKLGVWSRAQAIVFAHDRGFKG